jgi:rfaE bifunctional protein nucleotidyltransferase chain/domain
MSNSLEIIQNKIFDFDQLGQQLNRWRFFSKKIVFTNGCFDILHLGHIDYLAKASDEGDILIVGVNSDKSTTGLKGPKRPINGEKQRTMLLASLQFIDAVILFDEPTPLELIKFIQPDVLVKGGDYKIEEIVGYDIVNAKKGIIKTIDILPGFSTTLIEEKIRHSNTTN